MRQQRRTQDTIGQLDWWSRLLVRLSARLRPLEAREYSSGLVETFVSEDPMPQQFCHHSRLARLIARLKSRLTGGGSGDARIGASGLTVCPICGMIPMDAASMEFVLTVWFRDGDVYEYVFPISQPDKCYRVADNALHIFMKESTVSYPLDAVVAVNFGSQYKPPVSPEVLEAERIIAGSSSDED